MKWRELFNPAPKYSTWGSYEGPGQGWDGRLERIEVPNVLCFFRHAWKKSRTSWNCDRCGRKEYTLEHWADYL